jgi:hypothetical protein
MDDFPCLADRRISEKQLHQQVRCTGCGYHAGEIDQCRVTHATLQALGYTRHSNTNYSKLHTWADCSRCAPDKHGYDDTH